jgi:hypothetical protein
MNGHAHRRFGGSETSSKNPQRRRCTFALVFPALVGGINPPINQMFVGTWEFQLVPKSLHDLIVALEATHICVGRYRKMNTVMSSFGAASPRNC